MYIKDPLAGLKLRLGTHSTGNLKKKSCTSPVSQYSQHYTKGAPPITFLKIKVKFLFTTPISTLTQHSLQTTVMPRRQTFHCRCCLHACATHNLSSVIQTSLQNSYILYLMLLNSWWFDGFLSRFKGFFIWSRQWYRQFGWPWVRKYWHYIYICFIAPC